MPVFFWKHNDLWGNQKMSELKSTNELDNYGVWVKNPPKTVDSSLNQDFNPDDFDIAADLPDFSELDETITSDSNDSFSDSSDFLTESTEIPDFPSITEDTPSSSLQNENTGDTMEEEISLDEFITDGVFETGPDEEKIRQKESEGNSANSEPSVSQSSSPAFSAQENSASNDDFTVTSDDNFDEPETSEPLENTTETDDDMLNIDLSFEDEQPLSETTSTESINSTFETESVDLSEFASPDFGDISSSGNNETVAVSSDGMEDVDLSEFGFDDIDEIEDSASSENQPSAPTVTEEAKTETLEDSLEEPVVPVDDSTENTEVQTEDSNINLEQPEEILLETQEEQLEEISEPIAGQEENSELFEEPVAEPEDGFDIDNVENDTEENEAGEFAQTIKAPILDEMESEEEKPSSQMTAIFNQIVGELTSLKNEIAGLKNELKTIKTSSAPQEEIEIPEQKNGDGFFSGSDEDETIALSTDELDNILNTAAFTEESSENDTVEQIEQLENENIEIPNEPEVVNDIQETFEPAEEDVPSAVTEDIFGNIDDAADIPDEIQPESFDGEDFSELNESYLEEEVTDSFDLDSTEGLIEEELPEEITIPKSSDILVESSSTDFISGEDSDDVQEVEVTPFEEPLPEESDIQPALTEENLDYLQEDVDPQTEGDGNFILPDSIGFTENFDEEQATVPQESNSAIPDTGDLSSQDEELSGELKSEIKSVLSYMDQLLENLPEDKIEEFAKSEQFDTYKKLFKKLGLA